MPRDTAADADVLLPDLTAPPLRFGLGVGPAGFASTTSAANIGASAVSAGKASAPAISFLRQS